jgi:hypothetical protein
METTVCTFKGATKTFLLIGLFVALLGMFGVFTQHGEAFAFFFGVLLVGVTLFLQAIQMESDKPNPEVFLSQVIFMGVALACFFASFGGI